MARRACTRRQHGTVMVLFAFLLIAIGAVVAMSINTGHLVAAKTELQAAMDSAAYAAAKDLDGTAAGITQARSTARDFAERHFTDDGRMRIDIDENAFDVQFGYWNGTALVPPPDLRRTNAVCVQTGRGAVAQNLCQGLTGGAPAALTPDVPTWFGAAFLRRPGGTAVGAHAVAVKGGPCKQGCDLPLVFAACDILKPDGEVDCDTRRVFNSDGGDNIAFTSLSQDPTNPNTVRYALNNCVDTYVGEVIDENNGAFLNPVAGDFAAVCGQERSAPVADIGGGTCAKYVGDAAIVGYTKVKIVDIIAPGGDIRDPTTGAKCDKAMPVVGMCSTATAQTCAPPDAACQVRADAKGLSANNKVICVQVECGELSQDGGGGCEFYGLEADKVTLVK